VFRVDLHPAMGANPLIIFTTVATETGTLEFKWSGDNGYASSTTSTLTVT
jgi:sulfur-oxidizing protein SoxZ